MSIAITTKLGKVLLPTSSSDSINNTLDNDSHSIVSIASGNSMCMTHKQLDGLNCGVPTRTTPTITPVTPMTLYDIGQLFAMETRSDEIKNEPRFIPPLLQSSTFIPNNSYINNNNIFIENEDAKDYNGCGISFDEAVSSPMCMDTDSLNAISCNDDNSLTVPANILLSMSDNSCSSSSGSSISSDSKKKAGGRRPSKKSGISPEEEEKRNQRRERNKIAAARCRQKRVDRIKELEEESNELEGVKKKLTLEIMNTQVELEKYRQFFMEHESCNIRVTDDHPMETADHSQSSLIPQRVEQFTTFVSDTMVNELYMAPIPAVSSSPAAALRPNFLPINNTFPVRSSPVALNTSGIPIETPSNDIIESLLQCGTGLTPITPAVATSCSDDLRNSTMITIS